MTVALRWELSHINGSDRLLYRCLRAIAISVRAGKKQRQEELAGKQQAWPPRKSPPLVIKRTPASLTKFSRFHFT